MATVRTRDAAPFDAYTGMLIVSLGALLVGCLLLFLDMNEYPSKKPEAAPAPVGRTAAPAPAPVGAAR